MTTPIASRAIAAARALGQRIDTLRFGAPATHVYNPLDYAWDVHRAYLERYATGRRRVLFLGMNPGPFGMVQTGVPFGEIAAVRDWLNLSGTIARPANENPKKPVDGFECTRSEVSGRRLWGFFRDEFGTPEAFFREHFVANYCPLAFFNEGRNLTPDTLAAAETAPLFEACDAHLHELVAALEPEWVVGVGVWANKRASTALKGLPLRIGQVLHPSPASPAANRGWAQAALEQLRAQGVWNAE